MLDLLGLILDQVLDSPRGLIVSIVRNWATLKTLAGLYMASPLIGSPDSPIKAHSHQASTETQTNKTPTEIHQSASSVGFNSDQLAKLYEFFSNSQASS